MTYYECPGRLHVGKGAIVACTLGDHEEAHANGSHHWYDDENDAFRTDRPEPTDRPRMDGNMSTSEWLKRWDESPATDPIGTVRVHPDDDPEDPDARRVIRRSATDYLWAAFTGRRNEIVFVGSNGDWPRQALTDVARVLGHDDAPVLARKVAERDLRHLRAEYDTLSDAYDEEEQRAEKAEAERDEWKQFRDADHFNAMEYLRRVSEMETDRDYWKARAESVGEQFRYYKITRPEVEYERDAWQRRAEHAEDARDKYGTALELIGHILRGVERDTE